MNTYTSNNILIKSQFSSKRKNIQILLFLVEIYAIKLNIIKYYFLLNSITLKLRKQKLRTGNTTKVSAQIRKIQWSEDIFKLFVPFGVFMQKSLIQLVGLCFIAFQTLWVI